MKKYLLLSLAVLISQNSLAQEPAATSAPASTPAPVAVTKKTNEREGFLLGFGVGGGGFHLNNVDTGAGFFDVRIGGGLTENILLMAELHGAATEDDNNTLSTNVVAFASQFFISKGFYARPGIGFSMARSEVSTTTSTTTTESDSGLGILFSTGYEFRPGKSFALSPEFIYNYNYIESDHFQNYGLKLGFLWYW